MFLTGIPRYDCVIMCWIFLSMLFFLKCTHERTSEGNDSVFHLALYMMRRPARCAIRHQLITLLKNTDMAVDCPQ